MLNAARPEFATSNEHPRKKVCMHLNANIPLPSIGLHFLHPPSRHNSPSPFTLNFTPPIALIRRDQHHLLALLHTRLTLTRRIIRVQRFDVAESGLLGASAPGSDGGTLLAAY